jgi:ubiquinone biosynthesis UbiH/UbiF/VisC/COQ6 family hydroxylase
MRFDIVIIGGGPAGLSFARSLSDTDLRVLLVERASQAALESPAIDGRDIAHTHLSMKILQQMGVLDRLPEGAVSPIREANVINGDSSYCLNIDSQDEAVSALGYLIPNYLIRKALYEVVTGLDRVQIRYETAVKRVETGTDFSRLSLSNGDEVEARLVVAADSRFSETRRQLGISASMLDFGREVIVSRMEHEKPHHGIAYECFHYGRTLAVLPLTGNLSSIVVTVSADHANEMMEMSADRFSQRVRGWFDYRLGDMKLVGERHRYPLVAVHANKFVKPRYALLGDAAVGMHPVTAHGFNLGLRGQDTLYKEIQRAHKRGMDIGSLAVLQRYESRHMRVTKPLYHATNEIVGLFTNDSLPARVARGAVLRLSNNFPPLKRMIANKLKETGEAGGLPFSLF